MPDRAARLARLGTRLVSALAGLLMLALLAFGGFALWQDAALRRGAFVGAELLQYKPAAPAADNPTLAGLQTVNPDVCGWAAGGGTGLAPDLCGGRHGHRLPRCAGRDEHGLRQPRRLR